MSHSAKLVSPKRLSAGLSLLVACVACSGSDGSLSGEGAGASANGGAAGSGGSAGAGSVGSGTGGATGAGGTTGSSGDTAAGGTTIIGGEADGESPEGAAGGAGNRDGGGNGVGDANTGGNRNTGGSTNTGGNGNTGGSRNTGGTTNTGGSANTGGAGGGPSTTACGVNPITPNASQQTKNLLCYLYSIKGNHVLSGQQEANWNANPTDIAWYSTNLGKFPAVLGSDFLYRGNASCSAVTPSTQRAIAYWNAGGIAMFRYHMGMPGAGLTCSADCFSGTNCAEPTTKPTAAFFTNVITPGTPENASLNAKLDYVAVQMGAMQAANMPVILAIFHETQPNGWFWWAETASASSFVDMWIYTFNYLTKTKGLTNIVWLMPFSGSPSGSFYPGKAYVDIGGPDEYAKPANLATFNASGNYGPAASIFGNTMPIALHETGSAVQPDTMFPTAAPWILFNVWATYENTAIGGFNFNTVSNLQAAYASPFTITRDEVPSLK